MSRGDKSKRDRSGRHFHYACAVPLDVVVKTLMRLNRSKFLTQTVQDIQIQPTESGYQFHFDLYLTNSLISRVEGTLWEDEQGRAIVEGTSSRRYWAFLFWIPVIVGGSGAALWFLVLTHGAALYNPDWGNYRALPLFLLLFILLHFIAVCYAFHHTAYRRFVHALKPLQASHIDSKLKRLSLTSEGTAATPEAKIATQPAYQRLNNGR